MNRGLVILFVFIHAWAVGQGCSDAGFCTMGAMKPDQPFNKNTNVKLRSIEFSQYYGITHFNNHIWVSTLEANIGLGDKYIVQAKIPYLISSGHLGTYQSLSDISLSVTKNIVRTDELDINVTVGTKIPSNNGDQQQYQGRSLPMYYQTSLGTHDLILGASIITRKWLIAVGYQQALDRNQNGFWWGEWRKEDPADTSYILRYAQSNNLQRGKDIMIRVERDFRFSRFNASIGLLPIYRINRDDIQVPSLINNSLTPKISSGSDGLALSGIYTLGYHFNVNSSIKLLVGNRFIQREKNPDGLSREFVTSLTYSYRF
ncbi:MAG: hypothetical protein OJF59_002424 [Cytophagales bacterium]|jgi:hypothetical protein|nr:hypothetical protein [Bacteroidota bacterium]MBS1980159.1 hypothetical protein [Bacteroidota bacterium]WHZ08670.1 MAG: hypothetical protein OJF59_002424 [Cytophagales bacterium]